MSTGDFPRLRELFDRVAQLDPVLREAVIHNACGDDAEMERELRSLLDAHDREAGRTGETRVRLLDEGTQALASAAEPGDRVGPFVLREQLGRGGMGVVYRAERVDGAVQQQVAVKVLQRMHLDEAGVRRFQQERDIVAQLSHPGIARLFDAGTTREGFPYYAMELVDGQPITAWCDARKSTIPERLDLFLKVCDAVRFAHANLVLHRDIKPANVLVDASGAPKLIDFGIAKAMTAIDTTVTGLQLFSPSNAAPEQLRGERCGVACDVYQLGTLLYELLTGTTVLGDTTASAAEIEAAILHRVPLRPSDVVAYASDEAAGRAAIATAKAWSAALQGDLDTIVMRALRKEPEQRYTSVEQFVDEVARHQRNEPIAARGGERAYRLRKFLRRHRAAIAAASIIIVLVATVVTVQLVQSQRLERERDAARMERNRAQAISIFLANLFQGASPGRARAHDLTATDLLQRGRERIANELADEPSLRLPLLALLSNIYISLGDQDTASKLLEDAEQLLASGVTLDDRSMVEFLLRTGEVKYAMGDTAAAMQRARDALAIQVRLGDPPGKRWESRQLLMGADLQRTPRSQWKDVIVAVVRELESDPAIDPLVLARARVSLGHSLEFAEEYELAEAMIRAGLAVLEARLPENNDGVHQAKRSLASLLLAMGRASEALPMLEEHLQREIAIYGRDMQQVARARLLVGQALTSLDRHEEAEVAMREALDDLRVVGSFPQGGIMVAQTYLGGLFESTGRLAEAEASYREAVRIADAIGGVRGTNSLELRKGLAGVLARQDRWQEAAELLRECEPLVAWTMPEEARWGVLYAEVLYRLERRAEAAAMLARAQELIERRPERLAKERERAATLRKLLGT